MAKDDTGRRRRLQRRLAAAAAATALLLAVILVPPFINVQRYRGRVAALISASLGRPVRLSSVELRLLPRPGFVLTDLTVDEDPAYGWEPLLHANTVKASIRLLSLWRGLEINHISVDEASLNLVRTPAGRWNVESLFRTASQPGSAEGRGRRRVPFPYLEATELRINVKKGVEKLPYSLLNSDVSFWEDDPGEWRIRMRGQPARTDVALQMADTGTLRLNADLHRAAELRQMPMNVDIEWREAQLGQLTRLLVGSDPGWRGDLTGEFHMEGTPDAAKIRTRLRASGVHREEFAPAEAMDFDATCALVYHYSSRAVDGLDCNSPLGDGRIRLAGSMPGDGAPKVTVELDKLPVEAALDALRTVRNGIVPELELTGTVSGKVSYDESAAAEAATAPAHPVRTRAVRAKPVPPNPLAGSFTVQGLEISGKELKEPVRLNKVVLEPKLTPAGPSSPQFTGLVATAAVPAGGATPLTVTSRLTLEGYQISVRGPAAVPRVRELAQIAGIGDRAAISGLTGGAATLDVSAEGPWVAPEIVATGAGAGAPAGPDLLSGTISLRDAHWKADFLANPITIAQATLQLGGDEIRWDPVAFAYGPVKGTARLSVAARCERPEGCAPAFALEFGALDAGEMEAAILGAPKPGTLLSELIARLTPQKTPAWPELEGTVKADSLILGPVTLEQPEASLQVVADGVRIRSLNAGLLGGEIQGAGTVRAPGANGNATGKPSYELEGDFARLNPASVGKLMGQRWAGGAIGGTGRIELAGYTGEDFASSAAGSLHFEWTHGGVHGGAGEDSSSEGEEAYPAALTRFDRWAADATIGGGKVSLQETEVRLGAQRSTVSGTASFGTPVKLSFGPAKPVESAHR